MKNPKQVLAVELGHQNAIYSIVEQKNCVLQHEKDAELNGGYVEI